MYGKFPLGKSLIRQTNQPVMEDLAYKHIHGFFIPLRYRRVLIWLFALLGAGRSTRAPPSSWNSCATRMTAPTASPRQHRLVRRQKADLARTRGPELTKRPPDTHKETKQERQAALRNASDRVRSGLNPALFSDMACSAPHT